MTRVELVATRRAPSETATEDDPAPSARTRAGGALAGLHAEFPSLEVVWRAARAGEAASDDAVAEVDEAAWRRPDLRFVPIDEAVDRAVARGATALRVVGAAATIASTAAQVLTRYQRHVRRTNHASARPEFAEVLARHRALHDVTKPLVKADHDHALDVWQWILRLDHRASVEVQLAGLFHDVERLVSEADARIEQHARDYQAFKDAHARAGAAMAAETIRGAYDAKVVARVTTLIARHERPSHDAELRLLNDADALSFFSLNSSGFWDYFGAEHTKKKVAWTLARMSPRARARVAQLRLRAEIAALVQEGEGSPPRGLREETGAQP